MKLPLLLVGLVVAGAVPAAAQFSNSQVEAIGTLKVFLDRGEITDAPEAGVMSF
jgi:hypothetical protein